MRMFKYFLFGYARPCSHYIPRCRRLFSRRKHKVETYIANRLTIVDDLGNWQLKGVRWCDLYVVMEITKEVQEKVIAALTKLLCYEDTGLTPEEVERMKERWL